MKIAPVSMRTLLMPLNMPVAMKAPRQAASAADSSDWISDFAAGA
jgi:hypothetical protein